MAFYSVSVFKSLFKVFEIHLLLLEKLLNAGSSGWERTYLPMQLFSFTVAHLVARKGYTDV